MEGADGLSATAGHGKNHSGKVAANDLHMNLENTVSLLSLACDRIFLTRMHWHEGSLGPLCNSANLLA